MGKVYSAGYGEIMRTESFWDEKLHISTCGRLDYQEDKVHFPYEPTPYCVLERLAESGYIGKDDILLDYGCGKGRVPIFMSARTGCRSIGVEYDMALGACAEDNRSQGRMAAVSIERVDAEKYTLPPDVNRCYFFNPFGEQILRGVLDRICSSFYESPREILLFFYYPNEEHVAILMTRPELMFVDEIDCMDLFPGNNPRERILVFSL